MSEARAEAAETRADDAELTALDYEDRCAHTHQLSSGIVLGTMAPMCSHAQNQSVSGLML